MYNWMIQRQEPLQSTTSALFYPSHIAIDNLTNWSAYHYGKSHRPNGCIWRTQIPNQARRIVGKIQHDKEKKNDPLDRRIRLTGHITVMFCHQFKVILFSRFMTRSTLCFYKTENVYLFMLSPMLVHVSFQWNLDSYLCMITNTKDGGSIITSEAIANTCSKHD